MVVGESIFAKVNIFYLQNLSGKEIQKMVYWLYQDFSHTPPEIYSKYVYLQRNIQIAALKIR